MFLGEWFWMIGDVCGCLQMFLGGFRLFSVISSFSSNGEICFLKFKRSRQLWGVFVVFSNNDAEVPFKTNDQVFG